MKRCKRKQVIPGFGISMGITLTLLSLVVLIPMASLVLNAQSMGIHTFLDTVTDKRVVSGYIVSFTSSLIAAIINGIFGVF